MCAHVALVAQGLQVVCVEHECALVEGAHALLHGGDVVHLGGGPCAPLGLAPLTQRVAAQHLAAQHEPAAGVYLLDVLLVFGHGEGEGVFKLISL